jgi:hypothetical protein
MSRQRLETVSDLARAGYNLRITCVACGHVIDASAIEMMRDLHARRASLSIEVIERRAKCSNCGERRASIRAVIAEW